jgi:DNA-binding CsgD family transcriptional regulator
VGISRNGRQQDQGNRPQRRWVPSEVGLIVVDSSFSPIVFNSEAAVILNYPERPNVEQELPLQIPEEILTSIRGRPPADFAPIVSNFRAGKRRYTCQAYAMISRIGSMVSPVMALLLQRNSSTVEAVYEVAAQYNLTGREREALEGISAGLTSKELAKQMNISPNTVKAYLRIIMVKMGVNSRAAIVARILEQSAATPGKLVSAEARKTMGKGA